MVKRIYNGESSDHVLKKIGVRIQNRRRKLGLSQRDFAFAVGCDHSTIGHYERGERGMNIHTLVNVAAALGCTLEDLVRDIDHGG